MRLKSFGLSLDPVSAVFGLALALIMLLINLERVDPEPNRGAHLHTHIMVR